MYDGAVELSPALFPGAFCPGSGGDDFGWTGFSPWMFSGKSGSSVGSTLVLAWLTELVLLSALSLLSGRGAGVLTALPLLGLVAVVEVVKLSIYILMVAVFAQVVLSWVAPYSPAMPVLNSVTRPFLLVFSKRIPPVGNVDLSPIFVIVTCQLALFLVDWVGSGLLRASAG